MAELKTRPTDGEVEAFLRSVPEPAQSDCRDLVTIMSSATGADPVMWGTSIVGFAAVHYRYASGREGHWLRVGFSPGKRALTVYLMDGVDRHTRRLERLGEHTVGKGCLYIKRLDDVDMDVLVEIVNDSASSHD